MHTTNNLFTKISIPLVDLMIPTSITLPLEMLEAATIYTNLNYKQTRVNLKINFYASLIKVINSLGGIKFTPNVLFSDKTTSDIILIPALWGNPAKTIRKNIELINWIKKQYDNGAIFVASGTGVIFLAEAGLLANKPATTHWYYLDQLQLNYPEINFKPNHLITKADNIYCAGSVNSVADLMVHLISELYYKDIALKIEQQFSHEIRRSFNDIYYSTESNLAHTDEEIVSLQAWIQENYNSNLNKETLCNKIKLKSRTLNRRFKLATGSSPIKYINNIRIKQAKELLKQTDLSITEVSQAVGYLDSVYFTKLFKGAYKITPRDFRKSVREKLFKSKF